MTFTVCPQEKNFGSCCCRLLSMLYNSAVRQGMLCPEQLCYSMVLLHYNAAYVHAFFFFLFQNISITMLHQFHVTWFYEIVTKSSHSCWSLKIVFSCMWVINVDCISFIAIQISGNVINLWITLKKVLFTIVNSILFFKNNTNEKKMKIKSWV